MQQSLKLLAMPTLELSNLVQQELVENPVLEESDGAESQDEEIASLERQETESPDSNEIDFDPDWMSYFEDSSDFGPIYGSTEVGSEDYEPVIVRECSMKEDLERNLHLSTSDPEIQRIGERIIALLDSSGYLLQPLETISENVDAPLESVEKALQTVQALEPPGIGARDLRECLLLQYEAKNEKDTFLKKVIQEHLEDLERRRFAKIAQALKVSERKIQEIADLIGSWEPIPARKYLEVEEEFLSPDVFVEKVDGDYQVRINDEGAPRLRISGKYRQMLADRESLSKEEYEFLKSKCNSAIWLVRNIEQRRQTLYKVTKQIVEFQLDFLEYGISAMKPLKLQDVADAVGVHETTVCRVVNNKYVQTPRGLFELKFFFSSGLDAGLGESTASKAVMDRIMTLIDQEPASKPLSDQKLANLLKQEGITVARRTVAKYREAMNILPTHMRKRVK